MATKPPTVSTTTYSANTLIDFINAQMLRGYVLTRVRYTPVWTWVPGYYKYTATLSLPTTPPPPKGRIDFTIGPIVNRK